MQNLSDPRTQLPRLVPGARADGARSSRRSPRRRPPLFAQPRHDVRARSPTSRGPHPGSRSRTGRRRSTRPSRAFPQPAAVPGQHARRCSTSCGPACARCAPPRRRSPTRSRSARRTLRAVRRSTRASSPRSTSLERFADDPLVALGVRRPDEHRADPQPDARVRSRRPDGLQLRRRCGSATSRACSARATRTAPGSASSSSPRRRARTTRAARPRRRPTAPERATTTCTRTRTRTPPRPASRKECEAGNETYAAGPQVIGNVPGNQGTRPRQTTRSTTE